MEELTAIRTAGRTGPKSRLRRAGHLMGMQLILCPLTSLRTLHSPTVPTWLNLIQKSLIQKSSDYLLQASAWGTISLDHLG